MHTVLTIKLQADTKDELINTFPSKFAAIKEHMETLHKSDVFGPAADVEVRWLLETGGWRGEPEQVERDPNNDATLS